MILFTSCEVPSLDSWFKQYLFMINIQVYNYYNTWLKGFDKIEKSYIKSSPSDSV